MSEQNFLRGARVYLSGPMDFVASRADEKKLGWRNRVGDFLRAQGAIVFDPWFKPGVRGAHQYGLEDIETIDVREEWTFAQGQAGDEKRSRCAEKFWETLHIDLRMVDTSDFTIAYVPTNVYSVGTVHEIVLSRLQWKPVLFVSPPVTFPALEQLRAHLRERADEHALRLLEQLATDVPVKPNPRAVPSLWYMPLVGSGNFFDGFGFAEYRKNFNWAEIAMDEQEKSQPPQNPLLPFIEKLTQKLPQRWDNRLKRYVPNDDWLLWELNEPKGGDTVRAVHESEL
ncbi:MAG: hypothetical protein H0X34_14465 [Chthoniobacterales bacterium]|nr:hypothetical protein [Chthoniobacterales bacterium]